MLPDLYIVGDLDQVINFGSFPDAGRSDGTAVNTAVAANFHIILQDYIAQLRNLLKTIFCRLETEAIGANYSVAVHDAVITNHTVVVDPDPAVQNTVFTDLHIFTDIHMGIHLRTIADFYLLGYTGERTHIYILTNGGSFMEHSTLLNSGTALLHLLIQVHKHLKRKVRVFNDNYSGSIGLVFQQFFRYDEYRTF